MPGRYTRLPSLNGLRTFEAAARHLSFSAAAEELGLTPSAISHQIRALEESLSSRLFVRLNPGMALTEEGRLLLKGVEAGFVKLVEATDHVKGRSARRILTICAPTPVASFWLLKLMPAFSERFPHLEPHIVSFDVGEPSFARDQLDLAILKRHVNGFRLQRNEALLMRDEVFPVCSPSLPSNERPLSEPAHLAAHVLIQEDQQTSPDRELSDGRLIRPLGDIAVGASRAYVLRWPDTTEGDAETMALRDFLLSEAAGAGVPID